jgi:hypothetical protein
LGNRFSRLINEQNLSRSQNGRHLIGFLGSRIRRESDAKQMGSQKHCHHRQ